LIGSELWLLDRDSASDWNWFFGFDRWRITRDEVPGLMITQKNFGSALDQR